MLKKKVEIFVDGSCCKNPGSGGYGIILFYDNLRKEFSGGYKLTTNNRMELMAAIVALEILNVSCVVSLYTDSKYLYNGITKWIFNWRKYCWRKNDRSFIMNFDLWIRLYNVTKRHELIWKWVKGHSGNYKNDYCDKLAKNASNYPVFNDWGYVRNT